MALVYLNNETFTVSNNGTTVSGTSGSTEKLIVAAGITGLKVDGNVDQVYLPGPVAGFTYQQVGVNNFAIYGVDKTTPIQTIALQSGATGIKVSGTDGTVPATLVSGKLTLGGATVTTTAGTVTPTTPIDTTDKAPVSTVTPTSPTFSIAAAGAAAGATEGSNAVFTVSLSAAQATATTVNYALSSNTGGVLTGTTTASPTVLGTDTGAAVVSGTGVTAAGGTLTFAPGTTSATITVPITFDSVAETGKGLVATLSNASTGTAVSATPSVTVLTPDAPAPTFNVTSNAVAGVATQEGGSVTYTITPSGVTDKAYSFTLSTTGSTLNGIATAAPSTAFSPASTTVTFAAGVTAPQTVVEQIVNNNQIDGLRGYTTGLIGVVNGATVAVGTPVTGLITDPVSALSLSGATTVNEGSSVTYTVTSSLAAPTGGITVPYTLSGNATLTADYTGSAAATGNITIAAGATTGSLILSAVADNLTEATAENVIVTLGQPSTGVVTSGQGVVTTAIADTSQGLTAGQVALSSSASSVNEGNAVTYTVTLGTAAPVGGLNIPYTLSGTSTITADYTGPSATTGNIAVAAGATTGTLVVTTVADNITEGSETLITTLGTLPTGYTLVSGQGTQTTTINDTSVTVTGQTYTLTSQIDTFTGTSGNDTFIGDTNVASAADQLVGGAGTDVLKLFGTTVRPVVTGIEQIYLNAPAGNFDISSLTDVTSLELDTEVGSRTLTVTTGQAVKLTTETTAAQTTTIAGNTPTSLNLTVNKFGSASNAQILALTGTSVATLNLTSATSTSNFSISNAGGKLAAISFTGDQATTISHALTTVTTIDASKATAGLNVGSVGVSDLTFTGGSGNDRLNLVQTLTNLDSVNGGAGTDTIGIDRATELTTANAANIKGFEVLELTGTTGGNLDVDTLISNNALTGITVSSATISGGVININSAAVNNISLTNAAPSTLTFTGKDFVAGGTSDTATITLDNSATKSATGIDVVTSLTFTNVDLLNIKTLSDGTAAKTIASGNGHSIAGLTATDLDKLVVSGTESITISTGAGTLASEIDASGLTGSAAISISTAAAAVVTELIKATPNADTITTSNAATLTTTLYTGGGSDTLVVRGDATAVNTLKFTTTALNAGDLKAGDTMTIDATTGGAAGAKVIIDFSATAESLFKIGGVNLGTATANVSTITSLGATTNVASAATSATVHTIQFDLNGDGVYTASSDAQITITGVGAGADTCIYDFTNKYFVWTAV